MQSNLILKEYKILALRFAVTKVGDYDFDKLDTDTEVRVGNHIVDPQQAFLGLKISLNEKEDEAFPFSAQVSVRGYFKITKDYPDNKLFDFFFCNGTSLLYGVIRHELFSIVSKSPLRPFYLPSVNFASQLDQVDDLRTEFNRQRDELIKKMQTKSIDIPKEK